MREQAPQRVAIALGECADDHLVGRLGAGGEEVRIETGIGAHDRDQAIAARTLGHRRFRKRNFRRHAALDRGGPNLALRARTAPKRHVEAKQHKSGDERQDEDFKHLLVQRTAPRRAIGSAGAKLLR